MKNNGHVTGIEQTLETGSILVSKTDLKGTITYCNSAFIAISGFKEKELLGTNHNLVRHPDMPTEAFKDLWDCMKAGQPWSGVVKNRCKNGDHYWVSANVTPIFRHGKVVEYMSLRTQPTREDIQKAEALYRDIREKRKVLTPTLPTGLSALWGNLSASRFMHLAIAAVILMQLTTILMINQGLSDQILMTALGVSALMTLLFGLAVTRKTLKPLKYAYKKLNQISGGDYFDWVTTTRNDEFGQLLVALRSMQTQLGFEVLDTKEQAVKTNRIKTALDSTSGNIMIADANHDIIYLNKTLNQTFKNIEADIKVTLPNFDTDTLLGSNIDIFHKNPAHQRRMLEAMRSTVSADLQINNTHLRFVANPIFEADGTRAGTVVEWIDKTAQVQIENEIETIVDNARHGDLNENLDTTGREGFIERLSTSINELLDVNRTIIEETNQSLSALARGDLTQTVNGEYQGAFGELKENINGSIANLTQMLTQIKETTDGVVNSISEISEGNRSLSQRTEMQVTTLEKSAAAMEEINGTIQHSAEHALEASRVAADASAKATAGGTVLEKSRRAMDEIKEANTRISSITEVIDGIAFQTNLLALNASVEAAHAAEHGGGFSVVAEEVRNLARRSADAAKEVQDLVKDTLEKVAVGTELVTTSGKTLEEIIEESGRVSGVIQEISNASQEQAVGAEEVNRSLVELDQSTQANAALAEETSAANMQVLQDIQILSNMVDSFKVNQHTLEKHERLGVQKPKEAVY